MNECVIIKLLNLHNSQCLHFLSDFFNNIIMNSTVTLPLSNAMSTTKRMKPRAMNEEIYNMIAQADALGPRILEENDDELLTNEQIDGILDLFKCPICLEVFDQPCRVRDCGHIFCQECAERNGRLQKPAYCALCRNNILTRRDLRKDMKL